MVCLSTLKVLPKFGFTLWVSPAECAGPLKKIFKQSINIQHLFPCGRRLQDVAASLQQGVEHPSELPMLGLVRHEMKWYSRNKRRLWCLKEATVEAVEFCMSSVHTAFLHGLTTQTDSLSVTFLPPVQYKECAKEFVNRKGLRKHKLCSHKCVRAGELPQQPLLRKSTTVILVTKEVECKMA